MTKYKLLLFDLDDTLLRRDKTISPRNLEVLRRIQLSGMAMVGISTSRSEKNAAPFTPRQAREIVDETRRVLGPGALIDADTPSVHYRNYPVTEHEFAAGFEECVETDFSKLPEDPLMFCVKLPSDLDARALRQALPFADIIKFVNSDWHKVTKKGVTKALGIEKLCDALGLDPENMISFGDDLADVEMLELSGLGVAMGNAVPEVKAVADVVIGGNETDAIAELLETIYST